jgi:hypothetical protein
MLTNLYREIKKPAVVVLRPFGPAKYTRVAGEAEAALFKAGFPVFFSVSRAAQAINRYVDYHRRKTLR